MEHWDLSTLDVEPHKPQVLHSTRGEARSIALHLPAGEELQDHQVHERAHVVVISGEIEIEIDGGEVVTGGAGPARGVRPERAPRGARPQRRAPSARARSVARSGPSWRPRLAREAIFPPG